MHNKSNEENCFFKTLFDLYPWYLIIKISLIIFLTAVLLDKYDVSSILYSKLGLIISIIFSALVIIKIFELKLQELVGFKTVNYLDAMLLETTIAFLIFDMYIIFFNQTFIGFKIIISNIILLISCIILFWRCRYIGKCYRLNKERSEETNVYDLKDLYDDKIKVSSNELIYIDEKEVDYDLLHRNRIIRNLYNVLTSCKTNSKFVISLNGSWGSGKTTLIKNFKREWKNAIKENKLLKDKLIIVDDFDPWIYESQDSLFRGLFDIIMNKLGMNFSVSETNKILKNYLNMIFSNTKIKIDISNHYNPKKEADRLRKMINSYLEINDRRLVIIIDNIERANEENIIFLFKIISTVLNFNRTIYLVSFDKKQMEQIFKKKGIDYEYLEKIIQMEINVPPVARNDINDIAITCFEQLLKLYGEREENIPSYNNIIKYIIKGIKDVRGIKRTINSIFNVNEYSNNYLNKLDALALEMISIKNPELYESIYKNQIFYISEDYGMFNLEYNYDNRGYNDAAKEYFISIFDNPKNKGYIDILSLLFPNIKKFKEYMYSQQYHNTISRRFELRQEDHSYIAQTSKIEYIKNIKEKRAFNARFFDLYFTYSSNEFIAIDNKVKEFINIINQSSGFNLIEKEYLDILSLFDNFMQKYSLETLEYYLGDIDSKNYSILLEIIYKNISLTNDESNFWFGLNAKTRAEYIISELINLVSDAERERFIKYIRNDYKNVRIISSIVYWLNPEKQYQRTLSNEIYKKFVETYDGIKNQIKVQKINIYNKKYYSKYNIYCFNDDDQMLKDIGKKIRKYNIFLFLQDMITQSSGTNGYGYRIDKETVKKILSYDKLEKIINSIKIDNMSEKEKFIISVFQKSKSDDKDESTIYLTEPFNI